MSHRVDEPHLEQGRAPTELAAAGVGVGGTDELAAIAGRNVSAAPAQLDRQVAEVSTRLEGLSEEHRASRGGVPCSGGPPRKRTANGTIALSRKGVGAQ